MVRALLGEASIDSKGLRIEDRHQGWAFRMGNIQGEMMRDAAERQDRRSVDAIGRGGVIWGVHWSRQF